MEVACGQNNNTLWFHQTWQRKILELNGGSIRKITDNWSICQQATFDYQRVNHLFGDCNYTTCKKVDDWGMVYSIVLPTFSNFLGPESSPTGLRLFTNSQEQRSYLDVAEGGKLLFRALYQDLHV